MIEDPSLITANSSRIDRNHSRPFYVVGGTVQRDAPCYVERKADGDLYDGLKQGNFCYVLTSRQMGKSSLMVRTAARLREEGVGVALLDLTAIGQNVTAEQWYDGLLAQVAQQLELEDELEDFWAAQPKLGPLQRWMQSLRQVVLPRYLNRLVIFIDEIDAVRSLPFSTDEFFAGIREFFNRRTEDPALNRLAFCLLGVASPSDLIRDSRTTPFNIGQRIELTDFTETEAAPLAHGLKRGAAKEMALLQRVLYWTGGHPYLTQRLCEAIAEDQIINDAQGVDRVCENLFLSHRAQERDDNLLFVRERILRGEADLASVLDLYAQVRRGKRVADEVTNPLVTVLRLAGITRVADGYLRVRNRIYERVFDRAWVLANMPDAEVRRQRAAYRRGLLRAASVAAAVLAAVGGLGLIAVAQKHRAANEAQRADGNAHQLQIALTEARSQRQRAEEQSTEAERQRGEAVAQKEVAEEQKVEADEQRQQAFAQREIADEQRLRALAGERSIRSLLYTERIRSAHENWNNGNLGRTFELLKQTIPASEEEDLRGFEWFHLWSLVQTDELALPEAAAPVGQTMVFSSRGGMLAMAYTDGTVRLWDTRTRRELTKIPVGEVNCLAVSHDEKILATLANNQPVALWDISSGRKIGTMPDPLNTASKVGFSADDRQVLSWSVNFQGGAIAGMVLTWWDVASWKMLASHIFEGPSAATNLSPNLELFARVSQTGIRIFDTRTFRQLVNFKPELPAGGGIAFSSDGTRLAGSGRDGVQVWDVAKLLDSSVTNKQALVKLPVQVNGAIRSWAFAFSSDNQELAIIRQDRSLQVWNLTTAQEVFFQASHALVDQVSYSARGHQLAVADKTGLIKLSDTSRAPGSMTFNGHEGNGRTIGFSLNRRWFASTDGSHGIRLVDLESGREVGQLKGLTGRIDAIAFSPDSKLLAAAGTNRTIIVWQVASRRVLHTLTAHAGTVLVGSVAFSPDGKRLASSGNESERDLSHPLIELWDVASGKSIGLLRGHDAPTGSIIFSPNGRTLAAANALGVITVWNTESASELYSIQAHNGEIHSVAFSPDGLRLASAGNDHTVRLWDLATHAQVLTLKGHTQPVRSVEFSPEGKRIATASQDGTVKIWSSASGAEMATYGEHKKEPGTVGASVVAFSPDGRWLASAGIDVVLRRAATAAEVREALPTIAAR